MPERLVVTHVFRMPIVPPVNGAGVCTPTIVALSLNVFIQIQCNPLCGLGVDKLKFKQEHFVDNHARG